MSSVKSKEKKSTKLSPEEVDRIKAKFSDLLLKMADLARVFGQRLSLSKSSKAKSRDKKSVTDV